VVSTIKWQTIDGTTGITAYLLNAKRLKIVYPMLAVTDVMDTTRAHLRSSNTPIAIHTATHPRISSENPPVTPIPEIATETGSPASPPVIPMTATKKKATEPRARIVAPKNIRTAMIVTPMGRFMPPPSGREVSGRSDNVRDSPGDMDLAV
jgi:hypothetical protein